MFNITQFVNRPGFGCVGRPIKVRANYFEITDLPFSKIYHYDIIITPEVPPTLNRKIFQIADNSFFGVRTAFDGRRNGFTVRPFPFGDRHTLDVTLPEDDTDYLGRTIPRTFTIRIKKTAVIHIDEIIKFLNGRSSITPNILTG
jgi:hypothetical protein